jgi:hypothetical protein
MWNTASSGVELDNVPIGLNPRSFLLNVELGTGYADVTHITVSGFPRSDRRSRLQEDLLQILAASLRQLENHNAP